MTAKKAVKKAAKKTAKTPKKPAKKAKGEETSPPPNVQSEAGEAVVRDGDITLIRGTLHEFNFPKPVKDKETGKLVKKPGKLKVKDLDGKVHEVVIPNKTAALYALMAFSRSKGEKAITYFNGDQKKLPKLFEGMERVFKVDTDGGLFAVVSDRYHPLQVEELVPLVKERFPSCTTKMVASTGKHGGYLVVDVGKVGPAYLRVTINCGTKNGLEAASAFGTGEIIKCKNQLSLEASSLVDKLPRVTRFEAVRHLGGSISKFVEGVGKVGDNLKEFETLTKKAVALKLDQGEVETLLAFHTNEGRISDRTKELILQKYADEDIAQEPGTLYGLVMAITWVGTHVENLGDGVKGALHRLGGELLLVAPHYEDYLELLKEKEQKREEKVRT